MHVYVAVQSWKNAHIGAIEAARKKGIIAAYLNISAIVVALVVACVLLGLFLGLSRPTRCQYNGYNYYYHNWYNCMHLSVATYILSRTTGAHRIVDNRCKKGKGKERKSLMHV